ncbi:hypothetical protein [Streptomyces sp. NPDC057939]|uniref:hypothetical protein n=1 Tax=Streptomyces sp. NPDC057939 TaxID=3346284 RepID=UPI0036E13645
MAGTARRVVWGAVVVSALLVVGLLVVVLVFDLDTGDKVASLVGAGLAAAGFVVAVVALVRPANTSGGVRAGQGGVAAGGSINGSAVGANSRVSGQAAPAAPGAGGIAPSGGGQVTAEPGGIAAGGDITGSALGDGSQVQ